MQLELINEKLNQNFEVEIFEELDSTNTYLKEKARQGTADPLTLVIAKKQTSGKGTRNRSFFSENGLYFSLLLDIKKVENPLLITTAAAVAVAQAIEKLTNKTPKIKWVNDIYFEDKKVCGILVESIFNIKTKIFDQAVLGIGINTRPPDDGFPDEIKNIATAIFSQTPPKNFKENLLCEILNNFATIFNQFPNNDFMKIYKAKSNVIGRKIKVLTANNQTFAKAIDIDSNGGLVVEYENGDPATLTSGEISIKLN